MNFPKLDHEAETSKKQSRFHTSGDDVIVNPCKQGERERERERERREKKKGLLGEVDRWFKAKRTQEQGERNSTTKNGLQVRSKGLLLCEHPEGHVEIGQQAVRRLCHKQESSRCRKHCVK